MIVLSTLLLSEAQPGSLKYSGLLPKQADRWRQEQLKLEERSVFNV